MGQGFRGWLWQWRGAIASVPGVTVVLMALRFAGALQPLELAAYDLLLRWRPLEPTASRVVLVGITENDITETLARPTLSDGELAQIIETIREANPRAIGLDIYRDLPHPPGSDRLDRTFSTTPNLVGIRKVVGWNGNPPIDADAVLMELGQVGANDIKSDDDGKMRRAYLFIRSRTSELVTGLGLQLAKQYLAPYDIEPEPAPHDPETMLLGTATFPRFQTYDGGYVRADDRGYQILIDYRNTSIARVSLTEVMSGTVDPDFFRDRVVLMGYVAESANDIHFTPLGHMTGVEIQAHVTQQIIATALGERRVMRSLSEPVEWLWIVAWILVASLWSWQKRHVFEASRLSLSLWIGWGVLGIGVLVAVWVAFTQGWWLPVVPTLFGIFGSAAAIAIYLAASATQLRRIFGRYITDEVVATLLETPEGLNFQCRRQVVTILMSDLRGFSTLSEQLAPERVVELLDIYLGEMTDIITFYKGTINEFMGDGILVFFGAPTSSEDDVDRAIACALAMEAAMPSLNEKLNQKKLPDIQMGIGINTGEVVVGNIGSLKRAKWSVIGTHINLAARIESCTVGGQVLISNSTKMGVLGTLDIDRTFEIEVKGFEEPILIHDVTGISGRYGLRLPRVEDELVKLSHPVDILYRELSGKSVRDRPQTGRILQLSDRAAEVRGTSVEEPLTNLKINLADGEGFCTGDIYAKVTRRHDADDTRFYVRFTAKTPQLDELLVRCREAPSGDRCPTQLSDRS
ncbi:adenylate/guanylate cyclase domain-containing protein [Geitlerinema sp. CS-897]|nr:adenylate/guanylate cyclase domain-containing protein [Geitlerinema sp. CS-897]